MDDLSSLLPPDQDAIGVTLTSLLSGVLSGVRMKLSNISGACSQTTTSMQAP